MLTKFKADTLLRCVTVAGCFLVNLPLGILWYYGNLATYSNSYFLYRLDRDAVNVPPEWHLSVCVICYVIGILTVDWWMNRFNIKLVQLVGILAFNAGTFLSFFSVQHSTAALIGTFMIGSGYSSGVAGMISLCYARKVIPKHVGLTSAVVSSAYGLGAIINNYAITAYINPDNLTPDVHQSNMVYFSQPEILDRVPAVFIVTGIISAVAQFLGFLLEHLPMCWFEMADDHESSKGREEKPIKRPDVSNYSSNSSSCENYSTPDGNEAYNCETTDIQNPDIETERKLSLKPSQVLRQKSLYILWFSMGALTYGIMLIQNYYKHFGQLWIKNDNFLTSIGSFIAVSNGVCRLLIGLVVDVIGVKPSIILVLSVNSVMLAFWYIAPILNRWVYFFCCQILAGIQGTMYVVFPMAALKLYGPTYYATNFGLILIANVVGDLLSPVIFSYLQVASGWFSMAVVGSLISTLALVFVAALMSDGKPV